MAVMLEIAAADAEHQKWERRWLALGQMYERQPSFADRDGKWGLRDFLDYVGQTNGFAHTSGLQDGPGKEN